MYGLLSGMNAIAPTFSLGVCGAFWFLLPAERQSKDIVSLHQHAFLAIITVADLLISGTPIRFFHIMSTWVFAGCYALNTMIVYYVFGESFHCASIFQSLTSKCLIGAQRDEIYPFLKYKEDFSTAISFNLMMTFGIQSAVFISIYCLNKLKFLVYRKCSSSHPDGRASESQTGLIEKEPLNSRLECDG